MADDFAPERAVWMPRYDPAIHYIAVFLKDDYLGLWIFMEESPVTWEIHTCLLPHAWGYSIPAFRELLEWTWEQTSCRRITGKVPSFNVAAIRLARLAGFERIGIDRKSFLKNGHLRDRVLFGISKPI